MGDQRRASNQEMGWLDGRRARRDNRLMGASTRRNRYCDERHWQFAGRTDAPYETKQALLTPKQQPVTKTTRASMDNLGNQRKRDNTPPPVAGTQTKQTESRCTAKTKERRRTVGNEAGVARAVVPRVKQTEQIKAKTTVKHEDKQKQAPTQNNGTSHSQHPWQGPRTNQAIHQIMRTVRHEAGVARVVVTSVERLQLRVRQIRDALHSNM